MKLPIEENILVTTSTVAVNPAPIYPVIDL
jgi:hypothetical protein